MLGLTFPGECEVELLQFPDPKAEQGEVVVQMKASGICGSDLHPYRGPKDLASFKAALLTGAPNTASCVREV
ncbi:zinc-containing alcohol dehydrogenase superfamily protein [Caballeronia calidae]|uniref:Zinc-containing alcohol dehydrogenase superfamily protein n=1 Tax=Caballeronia calidae TaxID=1777139 RepID=A0A158E4B8_9BURK|nr:zinc-containing alcohol dehydrogenase superfamily protein [Caballeronia calidae]